MCQDKGAKVKASVVGEKHVIETITSLEEIVKHPIVRATTKEIEQVSEEIQKEEGIYG
jgi:hypothetical protein